MPSVYYHGAVGALNRSRYFDDGGVHSVISDSLLTVRTKLIVILLLQGCWLATNVIWRTSGAVSVERKNLAEAKCMFFMETSALDSTKCRYLLLRLLSRRVLITSAEKSSDFCMRTCTGPSYRGKQWRQTEGVTEVHILVALADICLNKLASNCIQAIPRFCKILL
ncbi:hypothetical protein AKJ16_DCAP09568 [Drosera capensis]